MAILAAIAKVIVENTFMKIVKKIFVVVGEKVSNRRDLSEMKEEVTKLQTSVKNCNQVIEALTVSNKIYRRERNFIIGALMVIGAFFLLFRSRN